MYEKHESFVFYTFILLSESIVSFVLLPSFFRKNCIVFRYYKEDESDTIDYTDDADNGFVGPQFFDTGITSGNDICEIVSFSMMQHPSRSLFDFAVLD